MNYKLHHLDVIKTYYWSIKDVIFTSQFDVIFMSCIMSSSRRRKTAFRHKKTFLKCRINVILTSYFKAIFTSFNKIVNRNLIWANVLTIIKPHDILIPIPYNIYPTTYTLQPNPIPNIYLTYNYLCVPYHSVYISRFLVSEILVVSIEWTVFQRVDVK